MVTETHDPGLGSSQHYDLWNTRSLTAEKYLKAAASGEEINSVGSCG